MKWILGNLRPKNFYILHSWVPLLYQDVVLHSSQREHSIMLMQKTMHWRPGSLCESKCHLENILIYIHLFLRHFDTPVKDFIIIIPLVSFLYCMCMSVIHSGWYFCCIFLRHMSTIKLPVTVQPFLVILTAVLMQTLHLMEIYTFFLHGLWAFFQIVRMSFSTRLRYALRPNNWLWPKWSLQYCLLSLSSLQILSHK